MRLYPFSFVSGKGFAGNADRIVFYPKGIDKVRFLSQKLGLCRIQFRQKIRPLDTDTKKIIGKTESRNDLRVASSVGAIPLCRQDIYLAIIKSRKKRFVILERYNIGADLVLFQIPVQHANHGAVQHTDLLPGQRSRF